MSGSYAARKKLRNEAATEKIQRKKIKNPNKPNKHRIFPAILKGFHPESLQLSSSIFSNDKGKRYEVDKNGTIENLFQEK